MNALLLSQLECTTRSCIVLGCHVEELDHEMGGSAIVKQVLGRTSLTVLPLDNTQAEPAGEPR
jgi:hypothetical protein